MNKRGPRENGEIEQLAGQKVSLRHAPGFAGHVKIKKSNFEATLVDQMCYS